MLYRERTSSTRIFLLLFGWALLGIWSPAGWAHEGPGLELVVVLDPGQSGAGGGSGGYPVKAVELLVRLLGEDSHLGVVLLGSRDQVVAPVAPVTPESRERILQALAKGSSTAGELSRSFNEKIDMALRALPSEKARRRVLFFLAGRRGRQVAAETPATLTESQISPDLLYGLETAGITFYAAIPAQDPNLQIYQNLAAATRGCVWEIQDNLSWHLAAVKLFQYLKSPQETGVKEGRFLVDPSVEEAVLVAARAVSSRSVVLTSPSGARLTPQSRAPTVRWWSGPDFDLIRISRPRPGFWRLEQARSEGSRVFLHTGLTLGVREIPGELAADEVLPLTILLQGQKTANFPSASHEGVSIGGEVLVNDFAPLRAELRGLTLSPGAEGSWLTLEGEFPPLYQRGKGEIRLWAKGPDFQRQVVFPLTVGPPWYSVVSEETGKTGGLPASFKPASERPGVVLEGTLRLTSSDGTVAGTFIRTTSGAEIRLGALPTRPGTYGVEVELQGALPEGRHVVLALAPARLEVSPQKAVAPKGQEASGLAREEPAVPPKNLIPTFRSRRKWLWLGVSFIGCLIFVVAVYLVIRERFPRTEGDSAERESSEEDSFLRVKAQVEVLTKEKLELKRLLEEKDKQIKELMAEKGELQKELARLQEKSQVNAKTLEELERKLQEAEKEAEAVQSEYMALYARSQANKEALKKN